jgi:hypothetical protein
MADKRQENLLVTLRQRLSQFAKSGGVTFSGLTPIIRYANANPGRVFLFGSTLRGFLVSRPRYEFHDLDLVVSDSTPEELASIFGKAVKRENRFGGLHLDFGGLPVDMWPLAHTWAFHQGLVKGSSFVDLPKTTFLNIEAVTAELFPRPGRQRQVYSHGFFEAILSRCLEINFEANPFPAFCVVRSLVTAFRLKYAIGPRLAKYIIHHSDKTPLEELLKTLRGHYRQMFIGHDDLRRWLQAVKDQIRRDSGKAVVLPRVTIRQPLLWDDAGPAGVLCG